MTQFISEHDELWVQKPFDDDMLPIINTKIIDTHADFLNLFNGFNKMLAVSYTTSISTLDYLFEGLNYKTIELIIGDKLYCNSLETLDKFNIYRQNENMKSGKLHIFKSDRPTHSKLYILSGPGEKYRIINTSMNLTKTGTTANRQINHAWYIDSMPGNPFFEKEIKNYEKYFKVSKPYFGNIKDITTETNIDLIH